MALSKEEQDQLDALTRKAAEPEQEDFSIEIWDDTGAGAKLPFSQGRKWLERFGIGVEPPVDEGKTPKSKPADDEGKKDAPTAQRYFGSSKKPA